MRATEKKVLHLRHPEGGIFDEVIFVLSEDAHQTRNQRDMLEEAARIVRGETVGTERIERKKRALIPFLIGAGSSLLLSLVCMLLIL